jgi:hypothetical protein
MCVHSKSVFRKGKLFKIIYITYRTLISYILKQISSTFTEWRKIHKYKTIWSFVADYLLLQDDRKVTQHIPDICSICQKITLKLEIKLRWKQKTILFCVGNVHRVQRCMHSLFSSCLMQPGEEFLCHGNGSPDEILSICLTQENRELCPKLILAC